MLRFNALVIGFPEGGGPRADVGEYGDFMGTLQQISALVVGEMWGLRVIFLMPYSPGICGDFALDKTT